MFKSLMSNILLIVYLGAVAYSFNQNMGRSWKMMHVNMVNKEM